MAQRGRKDESWVPAFCWQHMDAIVAVKVLGAAGEGGVLPAPISLLHLQNGDGSSGLVLAVIEVWHSSHVSSRGRQEPG